MMINRAAIVSATIIKRRLNRSKYKTLNSSERARLSRWRKHKITKMK